MKTKSPAVIAARASPVIVNCFFFGSASGECRHPANSTKACDPAECAMLAPDIRENFLRLAETMKNPWAATVR
jgi:hypothetical protein